MFQTYVAAILLSVCLVQAKNFVNEWTAEIRGGRAVAEEVAQQHGYILQDEVKGFEDHYVLKRADTPHRTKRSAHHHTRKLVDDTRVTFVEQQHEKIREKRGLLRSADSDDVDLRKNIWDRDVAREAMAKDGENPDDPNYNDEWYLNPGTQDKRSAESTDLRVHEVWQKGITGKNVVVSILDDGIESNHSDIVANYDPNASFDVVDNDTDPFPRYDPTNENKHGTRCAGEVAMAANNNACGVGVAFDSKIGGVRLLDGSVTDRTEAESLAFNRQYIDIYSASWGPSDNGKATEKPGKMVQKALEDGVAKGRGGKGSIFAWASGNGGRLGDNCNNDAYTSSIYTFSVSSVTQRGSSPWYAEKCSSTLVSTYSSGAANEGKVVTADLHNLCTEEHSGTSAAAPLAAGILALVLEANPAITWRDAQHIAIHSARMHPMRGEKGWYRNGVGYCVNLAFGFGLMDALAMVELADPKTWKSVGEQHICRVEAVNNKTMPRSLKSGEMLETELITDGCHGQDNEVNFLEHLELILDLDYSRRGVIYAELESPVGTITSLMQERVYDSSTKGFKDFPLMSVHTWGENPSGTWKFRVADRSNQNQHGTLNSVKLLLYGTKDKPAYRENTVTRCENDDLENQEGEQEQTVTSMLRDSLQYLHGSDKRNLSRNGTNAVSKLLQELRAKNA